MSRRRDQRKKRRSKQADRRVLITGGSSYLGQHLVPRALQQAESAQDVVYTYYSRDPLGLENGRQLDVRDEEAVGALMDDVRPDVIIHTAGSNRPAETMEAVIRQGTTWIAEAAAHQEARLIHISTDVVFAGQNAPYHETDPPNPLHAYGRAKADAEAKVKAHADHVIVRTSLIYGLEKMDRGTAWMVEALQAGRPVTLFTNQIRNPIWAKALSDALLELVTADYRGILHVAGSQRLSRAAFGVKMLDWWGITEREMLSFAPDDGGRWPLDCTLDTTRAQRVLQTPLPGVDEVLTSWERPD
ncbi:MAG: SDR family oxidoreductase [Candidatus Promineifilaceae bacterium]|nr:SDR family oxidoreductase [Candidatus Promineifilaceae bacterium]